MASFSRQRNATKLLLTQLSSYIWASKNEGLFIKRAPIVQILMNLAVYAALPV